MGYIITEDCLTNDTLDSHNNSTNVDAIDKREWVRRPYFLHEVHKKGKGTWNDSWKECQCSYCQGDVKCHYGLNIPKDKTGWWIFKYWKARYVRVTMRTYLKK